MSTTTRSEYDSNAEYSSTRPIKPRIQSSTIRASLTAAGIAGLAAAFGVLSPAFPALADFVASYLPENLAPFATQLIQSALAGIAAWAATRAAKNREKVGDIQGTFRVPSK